MNVSLLSKLLFFISVITSTDLIAQQLPQIVPPAPNAAALAQYADIPVSKYTGVPNISIPIYTINTGGYELPINISYHASGIRAAQEASSVGLGWALNAGGVITRQVRGIDDFSQFSSKAGFLYSPQLPAFGNYAQFPLPAAECGGYFPAVRSNVLDPYVSFHCTSPSMDQSGRLRSGYVQADYKADTESDLYTFNFGSYSGKFVVNKDGSTVLFSPESGIIIKVINTNSWQATTPDGTIYKFTKKEYTRPYSFTSDGFNDSLFFGKEGTAGFDYISSWYLSEILLTNGENITFNYTELNTESWSYGPVTVNRVEQAMFMTCGFVEDQNRLTSYNNQFTKSSSLNTTECYLHTIAWNNGSINFSYQDRMDIDTQGSIASRRLNEISIKKLDGTLLFNTDGTEISNIKFNHSYFNSQDYNEIYNFLSLRLKLDDITVDDKKYSFNYLNPNLLPKKYSNSIDHWGYFNNKANLSNITQGSYGNTYQVPYFIPEMYVIDSNFPEPKFYEGANRDTNPDVLTNGILTSIQYPTKGLVSFEYEPNEFELSINSNSTSFAFLKQSDKYDNKEYSVINPAVASVCAGCYIPGTNPSFTLTKTTKVKFEFQYSPYGSQTPPIPVDGNGNGKEFGSILRTDTGGTFLKTYSFVLGSLGKNFTDEIELAPGTYKISASTNYSFTTKAFAKFSVDKALPASKKITGGGVRIKKIISEKNTQQFFYNQESDLTKTSGLLMIEPHYAYFDYNMFECFGVFVRNSNPVHALSDSGATIAYSCVKETISDGINTSNIVTKYKNHIEFRSRGSNTPLMPAFDNGLLLEEWYLNNDRIVSKKIFNYENALIKRYELYDTYFLRINFNFDYCSSMLYYRIMPEWWKLTSETHQNYFYDSVGSQQIVSSLINYEYNINNFQVNKTTTTNSKGQVVIQKTTYPVDYTSSTYTNMKLSNIISKPIEKLTMVDGIVTQAQLNTFTSQQLWPDGEVQIGYFPEFVYSFKSTNGPTETTFTKYDGTTPSSTYYKEDLRYDLRNFRGDPLQITVSQAKKYTYLWGYNQNYPVAQVENATFAQVEALSGFGSGFSIPASLSIPQETSLRTNLPNSMVTTYTYIPLVGVHTITDLKGDIITYTYDIFGRLEFVKDKNGNILSENQYNYKP